MDTRKHLAGASATPPTPPASPSTGYPTDGNPLTNTPATSPGAWWYHQLSEEQRNVILAASISPDHTVTNQLLAALNAGWGMAKSLSSNPNVLDYIRLPGGAIVQWGVIVTSATADTVVTYPIPFPTIAKAVIGTVGAGVLHCTFVTNTTSNSSFLANAMSSGGRNAFTCSWFAIGH